MGRHSKGVDLKVLIRWSTLVEASTSTIICFNFQARNGYRTWDLATLATGISENVEGKGSGPKLTSQASKAWTTHREIPREVFQWFCKETLWHLKGCNVCLVLGYLRIEHGYLTPDINIKTISKPGSNAKEESKMYNEQKAWTLLKLWGIWGKSYVPETMRNFNDLRFCLAYPRDRKISYRAGRERHIRLNLRMQCDLDMILMQRPIHETV